MNGMHRSKQRGFSVLEALVSLGVFLGILTIVMTIYAPSRRIYNRGEGMADIQQNVRLAMSELSRQIRMAGYFPENFSASPPSPLLSDPVLLATSTALAIHGDADGTGASNVFLFCLDGNNLRRGRAAVDAIGAYTCADGEIVAEGVIDLRFTFYDAAGTPVPDPPAAPFQLDDQDVGSIPDLSDMTQRESVRRIVVTLRAEDELPIGENQSYALASDVWLRNIN